MRVSSTLMVLVKREQELRRSWQTNQSLRFTWDFHQLSLLDETRTKVFMRVDKRELAWEFSSSLVIAWSNESTRRFHESWTSESWHESFLNSRVLVFWEQTSYDKTCWWELMRVYYEIVWEFQCIGLWRECLRVDESALELMRMHYSWWALLRVH